MVTLRETFGIFWSIMFSWSLSWLVCFSFLHAFKAKRVNWGVWILSERSVICSSVFVCMHLALLSFITESVMFPWRASKTCWYNRGKRVLKDHGCIPIPNINLSFFLNVLAWKSCDCWTKDICLCSLWNSWVIVMDLWTLWSCYMVHWGNIKKW